MQKKTKKVETKVVEVKRKDVQEMLEGHSFVRNDIPEEKQKEYKGYQATYAVKVRSDGSEQVHLLICSIFDDGFRFAVMDDVGIIKLVSFKETTPTDVLERYIKRAADFLSI